MRRLLLVGASALLPAPPLHVARLTPIRTKFKLGVPQIDGENLAPWELRFDDVRCTKQ